MFQIFLLFLPCAVCLIGLLTLSMKLHKLSSDAILITLSAFATFYFFVDAYMYYPLLSMSPFRVLCVILGKGCSLCLLPLAYMWLRQISDLPRPSLWFSVLFIIPVVVVSLLLALFFGMGAQTASTYLWDTFYSEQPIDDKYLSGIYRWHFYIAYVAYHVLLGIEIVSLIVISALRIRKHRRNIEWSARDLYILRVDVALLLMALLMLVRICIGPQLLMDMPILSGILSLGLAVTLYILLSSSIYMSIIDNPAVNRETLRSVQQARQSELRTNFEKLMTEQHPYTQQGLTIEDVALMLATNRTYVSQMLRNDYGCTFPEYMTERRLEFSKQFMLEHPHDVQEEVAFQAGFSNASAFNKKFKDNYGVTPREWLITQREKECQ